MKRLTIDDLRAVLPDLEELRPLVDHLLAKSEADPSRTWSGSGALGTAGDRLVDADGLVREAVALAQREHEHTTRVFDLTAKVVEHLEEGHTSAAASTLLELAALSEERERTAHAEAYADAAYRIARDGPDTRLTSLALRRRARHRRSTGRYTESHGDYQEAVLVAEAARDVRGAAEAAVGAGNVSEEQGHWDEAAGWYRRAIESLDALADPAPETWHALLNLHVVLRSIGALDDARPPLERARSVAEALGDGSATPYVENAHGQLEMALGNFEAAEGHLRRAIEASTSARATITIRLNLAETLLAMDRRLDSAEEARRAEREAIVARLPQKLPEVYRLLGRIAAREGAQDAFVLFERALEIVAERDLPALERAQTLQAYAEAEARVGDPDAAEELNAEADQLYRGLGIEHRRREWADLFHEEVEGRDSNRERTDDETHPE